MPDDEIPPIIHQQPALTPEMQREIQLQGQEFEKQKMYAAANGSQTAMAAGVSLGALTGGYPDAHLRGEVMLRSQCLSTAIQVVGDRDVQKIVATAQIFYDFILGVKRSELRQMPVQYPIPSQSSRA